ncbi:FAD/NAD(P)-binding domain-containing protein, partial [Gymnopus androsaceus JB14]
GGGIAGLTCAVALKDCPDSNIEINLYEQAAQITEIGAGIRLWPRTWELLKSLGVQQDLIALLKEEYSEEPTCRYRISDRKDGFTFYELYSKCGAVCFHRQELQKTLLNHIPKFCNVHLSHRFTHCEEGEDSVKLFFKNGLEEEVDILIAADGIKSVARESFPVNEEYSTREPMLFEGIFYTGTDAFRGLIPKETFAKSYPNHRTLEEPIIYCGKSKMGCVLIVFFLVVYPISAGRIINVVAFVSNVENEGKPLDDLVEIRDSTTEEVLEEFSGWEEEVMQLLGSIEKPSRWAIRDLRPMKTYVSRRIALVGDAAHNMTPHLGAGAGQAMDDGYVLGKLLASSSQKPLEVLQAYNHVRQPVGNRIQRTARKQGFFYELNAPGFENIKTMGQALAPEQISILCDTFTKGWSWMEDDVDEDLMKAIKFLNEGSANGKI